MNNPALHHVGIVVPDKSLVTMWAELFGLEIGRRQFVSAYEAECIFTQGPRGLIEFVVPQGGVLAKFNKGMGGLHHVAFEVDDIVEAARQLNEQGVELLEAEPVDAGPLLINFISPIYTRGVIVELVQNVSSTNEPDS